MYYPPMIKMTLIETYNSISQFKALAFVDLKNGDVIDWEYQFNLGQPHQLIVRIAPQFAKYNDIRTREDIGIRLQTDTLDLAFVYFDRTELEYGVIELKLLSSAYKLEYSPLKYPNQFYSDSLEDFLAVFIDCTFIRIGADVETQLHTGQQNNYESIVEAISYPFFYNWLEIGIKETAGVFKTQIVYGDFRQIRAFYEANSSIYPMLNPIRVLQYSFGDNDDVNTAFINSYKINENTLKFNHVFVGNDSGTGSSANTAILLEPGASYVDPQYPIVTIEGVNYVQVPESNQNPTKIKVFSLQEPSNTENSSGTQVTNTEITAEIAYRKAVSFIQAYKASKFYNFDLTLKKLTLPGVPQIVRFKNVVKNSDGTIAYTQDINEVQIPSQYQGNGNEVFF